MNLGTAFVLLLIMAYLVFLLYRHIKKVRAKKLVPQSSPAPACSGGCSGCVYASSGSKEIYGQVNANNQTTCPNLAKFTLSAEDPSSDQKTSYSQKDNVSCCH